MIRNQVGVTQARPVQPVRIVAIGAEAGILDGRSFPLMARDALGDIGMIKRGHVPVSVVTVTGDASAGVVTRRGIFLVA